jgi:hypothetical protein
MSSVVDDRSHDLFTHRVRIHDGYNPVVISVDEPPPYPLLEKEGEPASPESFKLEGGIC